MTNIELAQKALAVYADRDNWTYVQGGLGEYANSARIEGLYNYYRKQGNSSTCDYNVWLARYGVNGSNFKRCTDCSNFIQVLINSGKNASVWSYTKMKNAGDIYTAPVGSILLIDNKHAGIVVQQGVKDSNGNFIVMPEAVDFYAYNQTCRKANYIGALWNKAVYLDGIDYNPNAGPQVNNIDGKFYICFNTYDEAKAFISKL